MGGQQSKHRGFTLVELMVVVAVVGVLAALSIYGVRRYVAAAKSAEAKQNVGDISRAAHTVYERERGTAETVTEGTESLPFDHLLCDSAGAVPAGVPLGTKYQPKTTTGDDFQAGDAQTGWLCLRFYVSTPIYHQYHYTKDGGPVAAGSGVECTANCYEAGAIGDIDGDGLVSRFARTGQINTTTHELKAVTTIHVINEAE